MICTGASRCAAAGHWRPKSTACHADVLDGSLLARCLLVSIPPSGGVDRERCIAAIRALTARVTEVRPLGGASWSSRGV